MQPLHLERQPPKLKKRSPQPCTLHSKTAHPVDPITQPLNPKCLREIEHPGTPLLEGRGGASAQSPGSVGVLSFHKTSAVKGS